MKEKVLKLTKSIFQSSLKKDIVASVLLRVLNLGISLVLMPLSIKVLNTTVYGIWLTIYGLNSWISLFDLGTQNSLRNLLSGNLTKSTLKWRSLILNNSIVFTSVLAFAIILIASILLVFFDVSKPLKISSVNKDEVNILIFISFVSFGLRLVSNNFNAIIQSLQNNFLVLLVSLSSSVVTLSVVAYYYFTKQPISILKYGIYVLVIENVISFLLPLIIIRYIKFDYTLGLKSISFKFFKKHLLSSNLRFFVLSLLVVFTFFSDNFFIGIILSYKDVTIYNLVNKYFNLITTISIVVLNPIWTRVAILKGSNDYKAVGKILDKLMKYFLYFIGFAIILLLMAPIFYSIFGDKSIEVKFIVSLSAALATLQLLYNNCHAYVLNGLGILGVQMKGFLIGAILIYPLYYILCEKFNFGVAGAFIVQILIFLPNSFMFYFATNKAINTNAGA